MEQSLVIFKPDGVTRGLVGRILQRFEDAGLKIVAMKMVWVDKEHAKKHYFDLAKRRGKRVFQNNVDFITEGPVVAIILEGIEGVEVVRKIVGSTEPKISAPGTIRGDFAHQSYAWTDAKEALVRNLVHASSSKADAKKEIALWFKKAEVHRYRMTHEPHTLD